MFRYTNGHCGRGGVSLDNDLKQLCSKWTYDGWVFGKNTYLCPYDYKYYFITRVKGSESRCTWNVQENGILNDKLISEVIRGVGRNIELENADYEQVKVRSTLSKSATWDGYENSQLLTSLLCSEQKNRELQTQV